MSRPRVERVGNDVFRVKLLARNAGIMNVINALGGSDAPATDWLLAGNANPYGAPNAIPPALATLTGLAAVALVLLGVVRPVAGRRQGHEALRLPSARAPPLPAV